MQLVNDKSPRFYESVIPEVVIGNPGCFIVKEFWIPACAGMTGKR